jgi:hypothetical protein
MYVWDRALVQMGLFACFSLARPGFVAQRRPCGFVIDEVALKYFAELFGFPLSRLDQCSVLINLLKPSGNFTYHQV